jgi:hypothetical protein
MDYLIEAVVVGVYSLICFILVGNLELGYSGTLLLTGFIKHFLGYYLGIHREYCKKYSVEFTNTFSMVFVESLGEALLYLITGNLLINTGILNTGILNGGIAFLIGFILHIIFELLGLHPLFCNKLLKDLFINKLSN